MKFWFVAAALFLVGCVKQEITGPSGTKPSLSGSGTDVGSAGDNYPDERLAAWFVGEQSSVRACVEVAPDFGAAETAARGAVKGAFLAWSNYIRSHRINQVRKASQRLSTQVEWLSSCEGSPDIRFYLGVEPAEVKEARQGPYNPTAFTYRASFDRSRPWGTGFIWVAKQGAIRAGFPDWRLEGRLHAVLMHEIGHVYGNEHVPGTIMTAEISELLQSDWNRWDLASVDHCRELAPCYGCKYETNADLTKLPKETREYFSKLGDTTYWGATLFRDLGGRFTSFKLDLEGPGEKSSLYSLDQKSTKAVSVSGAKVFKVLQGSEVTSLLDQTTVQYASLLDADRPIGVVALEVNLATCSASERDGRSAVHLSYVDGNEQRPFAAFPLVFGWGL